MKPLLLFLLLPVFSFSQKIKVNEIDKFTKQKRIETTVSFARQGLNCGIGFSFRSVDSTYFINVIGYGCAVGVVGKDETFIFLLSDSSTVTVLSKGIQSYTIASGGTFSRDTYEHEYYITIPDIEKLSKAKVVSVRAYYNSNYSDIDFKEAKQQVVLMKLSDVFLKELKK